MQKDKCKQFLPMPSGHHEDFKVAVKDSVGYGPVGLELNGHVLLFLRLNRFFLVHKPSGDSDGTLVRNKCQAGRETEASCEADDLPRSRQPRCTFQTWLDGR